MSKINRLVELVLCLALLALPPLAVTIASELQAQTRPANSAPKAAGRLTKYEEKKQLFNENTVMIVSGQTSGAYIKLAEDLQNILDNRETNELRILPVLGTPGPQNILDLLFLRGADMCMTETDYFDYFKSIDKELYGDLENKVHYITKLYNTEFHVVARADIKSLEDLRRKKVNFYNKVSSADISGRNLFKLLGIEVEAVNFDQPVANEKLKTGEIAAVVRLAGAPISAFADLKAADGFHFIPIGADNLPGGFSGKFGAVLNVYLPARLRSEDYPALIPQGETVATVASSVVLATYAWPEGSDRYRRQAKFVKAFFDNFGKFKDKTRHPKWGQTNLAADVPGWTRFKAAQDWLDGKRAEIVADTAQNADPLAREFEKFLKDYKRSASPSRALTDSQIKTLRQQFILWDEQQRAETGGGKTTPAAALAR